MSEIRKHKWIVVVAVLLVAMIALAGMGYAVNKASTYKIGAIFSVTGDASSLGIPEKNTALMLEKSINAKGGIKGHPIKIIVEDDGGDNTRCLTAAQKLIAKDKVLAIVGPTRTGTTMAIIDYMEQQKVPLISCAAGIEIVKPVRKWVFKTPQSDRMATEKILEYIKKKHFARIATISDSTSFGKGGRRELEDILPKKGVSIVGQWEYGREDTDMTVQLTKIRATKAQAVICWGTPPGPAIVAKNMKDLGMKIPLICSHGIANKRFIDIAGSAANGVVFPVGRLLVADQIPKTHPQKAVLDSYSKAYTSAYKLPADTFGGHAWDAIQLVKRAIEKGGATRAAIRDQVEKTKGFVGTSGVFNFSPTDHNGLTREAFVMVEIKNGDWTLIK